MKTDEQIKAVQAKEIQRLLNVARDLQDYCYTRNELIAEQQTEIGELQRELCYSQTIVCELREDNARLAEVISRLGG